MALRIAVFGQAAFGKDVTARVADAGHEIVGVYAPPESKRQDPLAELAVDRGWPLFRPKRFRRKGEAIAELLEDYRALGADLNLLPFTTVILPPDILDAPVRGSLCFHPSLLPAYRGGAALAWQIILGAPVTGVTVFRPDAGVDTGPIVVQQGGVAIDPTDTVSSLYFDKLYPLGVEAVCEAVAQVDAGRARYRAQPETGASFQGLVTDEVARIDWSRPGEEIDRLIRGCDPQPGAWCGFAGERVRLYASRFEPGEEVATPGTILERAGDALKLASLGGTIVCGKLKRGSGGKQAAADAGLELGKCFQEL